MIVTFTSISSPTHFNDPNNGFLPINQQICSLLAESFQASHPDPLQERILELQSEINGYVLSAIDKSMHSPNMQTNVQSIQKKIDQIHTDLLRDKISLVSDQLKRLLTSSFGLSEDSQDVQTEVLELQKSTAQMTYLLEFDSPRYQSIKRELTICQEKIHSLQLSIILRNNQKL